MRTVLIFAHECAPYHAPTSTIGAQRVAQFAKHLPDFGWRAIVVCCDAHERGVGFSTDAAARIERQVEEANPDESLIIPTPSLAWDGLLDRWWRASARHSSNAWQQVLWRKPLTALKQLTYGDYSSAWQPCARRAAEIVARAVHIDACIGEHTPDAGVMLARWFARRAGVPWIADFRDPVLRPFPPTLRALYLPRIRSLVSTAAHVVNVNGHLAELDRELLGRPATSIPNGFDPDEFTRTQAPSRTDVFTITYCGNLNPDIQTIGPFFEALRIVAGQLPNAASDGVRFVYRGNAARYVNDAAHTAGLDTMVDARPHVPREQALEILQSADVLLLLSITGRLQEEKYFARGLYPAKTFEYFGAKRPILCVPGDGGMLDALIRDTRTGVVLAAADDIAEYVLASYRQWQNGQAATYEP
ncbi:MAG: hypothetical protein ACREND_18465, partial [Gemmatimonadaceae bacterium]